MSDKDKEDLENPSNKSNKSWIFFSFIAMICFIIANFTVGQVSKDAGPFIAFYMAVGKIITGLVFTLWEMKKTKICWLD